MLKRLQKSMDEKDKGFTLIELLVVVIIIGILAGIAIPIFLNQRKKSVDAGIKSDLNSAATTLETYSTDGTWEGAANAAVTTVAGDFKITPGNVIVFSKASSSAGGYCLKGTNPDGTGTTWYYGSTTGGLSKTAC